MAPELCLFPADDVPSTGRLPALVCRGEEPVGGSLREVERELRQVIVRFGGLTVDVETSGYPVGHPNYQLRTVQLGDDQLIPYIRPQYNTIQYTIDKTKRNV